ncbi:hypothetical protein ACS0TY_001264 [Phlomoides rotata]
MKLIAPNLTLDPFQNIPNLPQNRQPNVYSTPINKSSFREGDPGFSISTHRSAFRCTSTQPPWLVEVRIAPFVSSGISPVKIRPFCKGWICDSFNTHTICTIRLKPLRSYQKNTSTTISVSVMEPGSNHGAIWPPSCWCKSGRMMIKQAGTEKNMGRFRI